MSVGPTYVDVMCVLFRSNRLSQNQLIAIVFLSHTSQAKIQPHLVTEISNDINDNNFSDICMISMYM